VRFSRQISFRINLEKSAGIYFIWFSLSTCRGLFRSLILASAAWTARQQGRGLAPIPSLRVVKYPKVFPGLRGLSPPRCVPVFWDFSANHRPFCAFPFHSCLAFQFTKPCYTSSHTPFTFVIRYHVLSGLTVRDQDLRSQACIYLTKPTIFIILQKCPIYLTKTSF
jgi:hypothetical protein